LLFPVYAQYFSALIGCQDEFHQDHPAEKVLVKALTAIVNREGNKKIPRKRLIFFLMNILNQG